MKKYTMGKRNLIYINLLIAAIIFTGCSKKTDLTNLDTKYVSASYVVDMNNPEEVVGLCNNVFTGYVEEMTETYYVSNFPYTRYNVKVIKNIKGELPLETTVQVNKEGGISEDESCYILYKNDFLPEEGKYYIFNVREKIEDGSYTASGINTVILIDDIDMQSVTNDIMSENPESLNKEKKEDLESSGIYQKYKDAYKNQKVYNLNKE